MSLSKHHQFVGGNWIGSVNERKFSGVAKVGYWSGQFHKMDLETLLALYCGKSG